MSRILMIGAGGVATVAAFKMAQNSEIFSELMIASHHKAKCDRLVIRPTMSLRMRHILSTLGSGLIRKSLSKQG